MSASLSLLANKYLPQETPRTAEVSKRAGARGRGALTDSVGRVVQLGRRAGHAAALVGGRVAAGALRVFQRRSWRGAVLNPLLETEIKQRLCNLVRELY